MGTHAMIGVYNQDGSVTASYCHYDGYLEGVGRTLINSYNNGYDAEVVARGGYLSALLDDYMISRQESVHSDSSTDYESVDEFLTFGFEDMGSGYLYIWDGTAWFFASLNQRQFEEVEMNLQEPA
jgi:hypothetical protein